MLTRSGWVLLSFYVSDALNKVKVIWGEFDYFLGKFVWKFYSFHLFERFPKSSKHSTKLFTLSKKQQNNNNQKKTSQHQKKARSMLKSVESVEIHSLAYFEFVSWKQFKQISSAKHSFYDTWSQTWSFFDISSVSFKMATVIVLSWLFRVCRGVVIIKNYTHFPTNILSSRMLENWWMLIMN